MSAMDGENQGELCVRCGEAAEDRRTLWMACLYAMHELKEVPFQESAVIGHLAKIGVQHPTPVYAKPGDEVDTFKFYTLRVCKDCRADWMKAIRDWFVEKSKKVSTGTGVFLRKYGQTYEATQEEVDKLVAERGIAY